MQRTSRLALACAVTLLTAACSGESLKRLGYAVGAQQACMAANEDHIYESAEDLKCTTLQGSADLSYDEYTAARDHALNEK